MLALREIGNSMNAIVFEHWFVAQQLTSICVVLAQQFQNSCLIY